MRQGLSSAKWGYVTRRVSGHEHTQVSAGVNTPRLGDFVVTRVIQVGEHDHLENVHGRRVRMFPGDIVVGAYGNRYATDFYEGYLPTANEKVHLLTAGGLIGTVASAHTSKGAPTELEVLGALTTAPAHPFPPTMSPLASPRRSGPAWAHRRARLFDERRQDHVAAALVRGLSQAGIRVGAGKVTGSGSGKDHWAYVDAGASVVTDFLDFGMASTFGYPHDRLIETMIAIRNHLAAGGAEVAVLEIADGVLQHETRALAPSSGLLRQVVLAVGDALGAVAGIGVLDELGVKVAVVSGLVTASPCLREAASATGLPVITPGEFAGGAALDLLPQVGVPTGARPNELVELGGPSA